MPETATIVSAVPSGGFAAKLCEKDNVALVLLAALTPTACYWLSAFIAVASPDAIEMRVSPDWTVYVTDF